MSRPTNSSRTSPLSARWSRRGLLGLGVSGAVLGLASCTVNGSSESKPTQTPMPTATTEPTQAAPTPTQPPIGSPVPGYLDPNRWKGRSITVASAAIGTYLDALNEAYFDAFAEATGATVRHTQFGRDGIAGLADQVEEGPITWDVVLIPTENVLPLAQKGYLTAIDYNIVDPAALYPEIAMQHAVGQALYSTAIVYPAQTSSPPTGWKDFWDLSKFGGTRALRKDPVGTLEFALLADGVEIKDLYPLDTARAFASLEKLRDATIFYEDSKQPVELVRTGQVGLASAWSVRTDLPDVASLVKTQWAGGMISADSWGIPKGSPNTDVAMSFINFATRSVPAATFSRLQPFGPVNKNAFDLLRPDVVATLPNAPENIGSQFFENWSYWAGQQEDLTTQFNDWVLNPPATPVLPATPTT
ncbi:MAG TPA: extracellular solute-binding protein [Thermomicrobiales bacterium]|nr:extracellular solute-binding protein [Thermomicrobiales bacterium]